MATSSLLHHGARHDSTLYGLSSTFRDMPLHSSSNFTKFEEGRWDYGKSVGSPITINNMSYPSASEALEDYISKYERQGYWKIRSKYDKDVEELLISRNRSVGNGYYQSADTLLSTQEDLRRHLAIRRIVDESYEKLHEQENEPSAAMKSLAASDKLLTAITMDNISPLPSSTSLATIPDTVSTDGLLNINPMCLKPKPNHNTSDKLHVFVDGDRKPVIKSISGTTLLSDTEVFGGATGVSPKEPMVVNDTWRDNSKLLSQSQLHNIKTRLSDKDYVQNGYHSDLPSDRTARNITSFESDRGALSTNRKPEWSSQSHFGYNSYRPSSSVAMTPPPHRPQAPPHPVRTLTPPLSSSYQDPEDTFTQLHVVSSKKSSSGSSSQVPSWVQALHELDSSQPGNNSTILTGYGQKSSHPDTKAASTPVRDSGTLHGNQETSGNHGHQKVTQDSSLPPVSMVTTPRKQLRFDLDLTQSSANDTLSNPMSPRDRSRDRSRDRPTSLRTSQSDQGFQGTYNSRPDSHTQQKNGILKSPKRSPFKNETSFTTEDISLGGLQYERAKDFSNERRSGRHLHLRSFSASGRLSSTPVIDRYGSASSYDNSRDADRPYISGISSVHTSATPSLVSSITGDNGCTDKYKQSRYTSQTNPIYDTNSTPAPQYKDHSKPSVSDKPVAYETDFDRKYYDRASTTHKESPSDIKYPDPGTTHKEYRHPSTSHQYYKDPDITHKQYIYQNPDLLQDQPKVHVQHITNPDHRDPTEFRREYKDQAYRDPDASKPSQDLCISHKDYLKDLVQDIEDGSSSVVTGVTELQDLLQSDGNKRNKKSELESTPPNYHKYGKPWNLLDSVLIGGGHKDMKESYLSGLKTPSELSDPPIACVGLEDSPNTDLVLTGDRPWEAEIQKPVSTFPPHNISLDKPAPDFHHKKGGIVDRFLQECHVLQTETEQVLEHIDTTTTSSSTKPEPPGTMEALKNMLFTMQSMNAPENGLVTSLPNGKRVLSEMEEKQDNITISDGPGTSPDDALSPNTKHLLAAADGHGGDSLERALLHLNRLKSMVKGNQET